MAIEGKNTVYLTDLAGKGNDITVDINSTGDRESVMISLGDRKSVVKISELYSLMMAICTPDQLDDLIPVRQIEMESFARLHRIKADRDIKQGEEIVFRCVVSVPVAFKNTLGGLLEKIGLQPTGMIAPKSDIDEEVKNGLESN